MKIQFASDLHLEFPQNKEFLRKNPIKPEGDILLLAGDIVLFAALKDHMDFFNYLSDNFQTTYWTPGNHEYYYSNILERSGTFNEKILNNVFLVNNSTITLENVKLIFSTLWSKINPSNAWYIRKGMNDFKVIKYNDDIFTPDQFNQLHEESLQFIKKELHNHYTGKNLVITHHVPTFFNYPPQYRGNILNEAFAVELFDLIDTNGPDYWIFGHTHNNIANFKIGKTQLMTNQLGYVMHNEQKGFIIDNCINL